MESNLGKEGGELRSPVTVGKGGVNKLDLSEDKELLPWDHCSNSTGGIGGGWKFWIFGFWMVG